MRVRTDRARVHDHALTGLYSYLLHIGSLDLLPATTYGRALLVKIGLFGLLFLLGALNLAILSPRNERVGDEMRAQQTSRAWTVDRWAGRALLVAALLSGCGGTTSGPVTTVTQRQTVDQVTIALEIPERAQVLTEQEVVVGLTDAQGQPIDGAEVWLALIMPSHQMSPNEPEATAVGNGRYRATALFTMTGTWNLEVHATVRGQEYVTTFRAATT